MKSYWRRIRPYLFASLAFHLANLLSRSLKIKTVGYDRVQNHPGGKICAGWHGRVFAATQLFRDLGVWTIISQSNDGIIQNKIFTRFGFNTIRGSSGRSGMKAALASIKVLKKGAMMAFTPDGPRGPSGIIQPGIMMMAQKSGAYLFPVGVSAKNRWLIRSWDRWMVPKPFSEVMMIFGVPLFVPPNISDEEFEQIRIQFEKDLHKLEQEAEAYFGHPKPDWHSPEAHQP